MGKRSALFILAGRDEGVSVFGNDASQHGGALSHREVVDEAAQVDRDTFDWGASLLDAREILGERAR